MNKNFLEKSLNKNNKNFLEKSLNKNNKNNKNFLEKSLNKNNKNNTFKLESKVLKDGFSQEYLAKNAKMSPDLSWSSVKDAQCYALVCFDPDSVGTPNFVHWILQYIPPEITKIPSMEIVKKQTIEIKSNKNGNNKTYTIIQGKNGWGEYGYSGPTPPDDKVHHYNFCLFALSNIDKELQNITKNYNKNGLNKLMATHILNEASLIVPYQRINKNNTNKNTNKNNTNNKNKNNNKNNNKLGNNTNA